jgi:hypothetical protein
MVNNKKRVKIKIIERFDTQEAFANALGYHPTKLSKQICGRYPVKEEEQALWARLLKCEPRELFG